MADFTRFISYLYDYRAGERNRNLGFAKVESRQGMCRMTVCLNHGQVLQKNMTLCGYIAEEREVYLVRLGEMERGTRERQWRFPADNLGSCGITLERLSGLILINEERSFFLLSVWNDSAWTADGINQAPFMERTTAALTAASEESLMPDEAAKRFLEDSFVAENTGEALKSEKEAEREIAVYAKKTEPGQSEFLQTEGELSEAGAEASETGAENSDDIHSRYQSDEENDEIAGQNMTVSALRKVSEQPASPISVRSPEQSAPPVSVRPLEQPAPPPDGWRDLCRIFPAARPFEPSVWEVLCISLQDIGRLPPENWVWGNNHFLLHGFYQYHHLILARHRVENRVYLGVPGEFGVNEKFMAAMFGLHQFQRERQGKSDKGYWLTPVRLQGNSQGMFW